MTLGGSGFEKRLPFSSSLPHQNEHGATQGIPGGKAFPGSGMRRRLAEAPGENEKLWLQFPGLAESLPIATPTNSRPRIQFQCQEVPGTEPSTAEDVTALLPCLARVGHPQSSCKGTT